MFSLTERQIAEIHCDPSNDRGVPLYNEATAENGRLRRTDPLYWNCVRWTARTKVNLPPSFRSCGMRPQ